MLFSYDPTQKGGTMVDIFTIFIFALILGACLLFLFFFIKAAVKSAIDDKLDEIRKTVQVKSSDE